MDPATFLAASRLVIVAGKGGVGKTTVTAALGRVAADAGLATLLLELGTAGQLAGRFGSTPSPGDDEQVLAPATADAAEIRGRALSPDVALRSYLDTQGLGRIGRRLASSGALDLVTSAVPGLADLLVLARVRQLVDRDPADLLILDAPATGHALSFLASPAGLRDTVASGPVHDQARQVCELLADHQRCQVVLVTIAEETPVQEAQEAASALTGRLGMALAPTIVNRCLPAGVEHRPGEDLGGESDVVAGLSDEDRSSLVAAATYSQQRWRAQQVQLDRLARTVATPLVALPELDAEVIGPAALDALAAHLAAGLADALVAVADPAPSA